MMSFRFLNAVCITASLVCFQSALHAQYNRNTSKSRDDKSEQIRVIGIAPLSPLARLGRIHTRAEYAYRKNMSISAMIGIPNSTKVPSRLIEWLNIDSVGGSVTSNRYKSFMLNVSHRFYFGGKKAAGGFYLEPYARYNRFTLTHEQRNEASTGSTIIRGRLGGVGAGGAFGVQWRIGEYVTLDFTALGLDFRVLGGSVRYESTDPNNRVVEFRDKVQETLSEIPIVGNRLSAKLDGNSVSAPIPSFTVPGARCNLTIGVAF